VCDLRIATRSARFGVPSARTRGNSPSISTCSGLASQLGPGRLLDMILRASPMSAETTLTAGFVSEACEGFDLERLTSDIATEIVSKALVTTWAAKESM